MGNILGDALQAGGSFLSSITSGLFNANQAKKDRAFQERMYEKQYQDSINFWNMQNEYNLPSAQYQRLMEGLKQNGLNPYLALDGAGGVSSVAQSAPQLPSAPHGSRASSHFENPFAGFGLLQAQAEQLKSQARMNDTQSEKNLAEALLASENTIRSREESNKIRSEAWYNWQSMRDRLTQVHAENVLKAELANTEVSKRYEIQKNIENLEFQNEWLHTQSVNSDRMTEQQIKESDNRIENANKTTAATIVNLEAQARKAIADAVYAEAMAVTENEFRDQRHRLLAQNLREAIYNADQAGIEKALAEYQYSMKPAPGSSGYKYQKWIETWVSPITGAIGTILSAALGGVGVAAVGKAGAKRAVVRGFHP